MDPIMNAFNNSQQPLSQPPPSSTLTNDQQSPPFKISPPLLNSASPWATTYEDLLGLYRCPHTGAVTLRTSLLTPFIQHPTTHQYTFFSTTTGHSTIPITTAHREGQPSTPSLSEGNPSPSAQERTSLNTLGYSPTSFPSYVHLLLNLSHAGYLTRTPPKPFIVSVTGPPSDIAACYTRLIRILNEPDEYQWSPGSSYTDLDLMMEINLSCPNIEGLSPPAYDRGALGEYLSAIGEARERIEWEYRENGKGRGRVLHVGIKTPPYTYTEQFTMLIDALYDAARRFHGRGGCPISFITATNTLGSCFVFNPDQDGPALGSVSGKGIGGLGGEALHPIALGNVRTIREMLDNSQWEDIRRVGIIGVGGVGDADGYKRMRGVGAVAVGVGTALGREGMSVFGRIREGLREEELM